MLVVTRYRVEAASATSFAAQAHDVLRVLAARAGWVSGVVGRNVDDPCLWTITTRWRDVGSYRRALSATDVKMGGVPLLSQALDEPSAYEVVSDPETSPPAG